MRIMLLALEHNLIHVVHIAVIVCSPWQSEGHVVNCGKLQTQLIVSNIRSEGHVIVTPGGLTIYSRQPESDTAV